MKFKQALVNARHHIVFLLGLSTALAVAFALETREQEQVLGNITIELVEEIPVKTSRILSEREFVWAKCCVAIL